jgi:hypothetical protein
MQWQASQKSTISGYVSALSFGESTKLFAGGELPKLTISSMLELSHIEQLLLIIIFC